MTEDQGPDASSTPAAPTATAGSLLREARKAQGLHIAALATTLKIPVRKLEALEADRYQDLPDPAFTRALAKTACRALKIDPAPVLALMPRPDATALDQVSAGLNTPFRDHQSGAETSLAEVVRAPAFWIVLVLIVGALAVYFWPASSVLPVAGEPVAIDLPTPAVIEPAASVPDAAGAPDLPASAVSLLPSEPPASAPTAIAAAPGSPVQAAPAERKAAAPSLLALNARADSWVEVTDAGGRTLLSRLLRSGEAVDVDGRVPLRVTVGNAKGTTLLFRGVEVDLVAGTRDNVARLELR